MFGVVGSGEQELVRGEFVKKRSRWVKFYHSQEQRWIIRSPAPFFVLLRWYLQFTKSMSVSMEFSVIMRVKSSEKSVWLGALCCAVLQWDGYQVTQIIIGLPALVHAVQFYNGWTSNKITLPVQWMHWYMLCSIKYYYGGWDTVFKFYRSVGNILTLDMLLALVHLNLKVS